MDGEIEEALRFLAQLPSSWLEGYEWPAEIREQLSDVSAEIAFDGKRLLALAPEAKSSHFYVPFLTEEYFDLGLLWAEFAMRAGVRAFAIAACDEMTFEGLMQRSIPCFRVQLPQHLATRRDYFNRGGFDGKALAIIFSRHQVIRYLLENGVSTALCDIDALLLRDPDPSLQYADVVCQRVMYFPKVTALQWGFSACGGFISCAPSAATVRLLRKVIALQRCVSSDQLAWNLALFATNVVWRGSSVYTSPEALRAGFVRDADREFFGRVPTGGLTVKALPATTFWRHDFVPLDLARAVLVHPNSPKSAKAKLAILKSAVGAYHWPSRLALA